MALDVVTVELANERERRAGLARPVGWRPCCCRPNSPPRSTTRCWKQFWRAADELGFHSVANYDHFYGLIDNAAPTLEAWTSLAAMAAVVRRARVSCLVTGVTYRNPAVLAKMAVTVDHISGGRLDFGLGAGWHEAEHRGYGIEFPSAGTRVAMLDEALTIIRRLWTEDSVDPRRPASTPFATRCANPNRFSGRTRRS